MRRTSLSDAICPIARSLDEIGDWWTLLIVRDALHGKKRFSEFQKSLGLAKNILSARLRHLTAHGIMEKRASVNAGGRSEYYLTAKGRRLRLVLIALRQWGEDNLFVAGEPMMVAHDRANRPIARLQLTNQDGRPLELEEIVVTQGRKRAASAASARTKHARGRRSAA
jgi:DNA-binding HxlR family transcriptional regulator